MPNEPHASSRRTTDSTLKSVQSDDHSKQFRDHAEQQPAGFLGELLYMIRRDKQWWLVPILVLLLVLSALVFLGGTAAAPFVYPLF